MYFQRLSAYVLCLCLIACQPHGSSQSSPPVPAATASSQYFVSGGIAHPGPRPLIPGDTVAGVIARDLPKLPGEPITIVLIRHAPEGITRQFIQLDAHGQLMSEKQNVVLRNGDELIFPGGKPTGNPIAAPQGGPG